MKYKEYLKSSLWKNLSQRARERASWKCEFCGGKPDDVHHVIYPDDFEKDDIINLVVCCRKCHALCHGRRDEDFKFNCLSEDEKYNNFLNNISNTEQKIFCSVCKNSFNINDLDMTNGKWVCREHD